MPSRMWADCFRIKEHRVERDVRRTLHVLLIMMQAQVKKGRTQYQ